MFTAAFRRLAGEIVPILVFSCAALGSLAVVRVVGLPQLHDLRARSSEISRYRDLVSDKNRLREITSRLLDTKEQLARQYARVAPGPTVSDAPSDAPSAPADLSAVLQLLILRAKEADIRFVKMEPVDETQRKDQTQYPVVLEMTTSYESLGRLVSSLEELPRQLSVDRLAITTRNSGLDVRILVTSFLKKAG